MLRKYNILGNLNCLAIIISLNSGVTRDDEQLKELSKLADLISTEYWEMIEYLDG